MLPKWTKANLAVPLRTGVRRPESSDTEQIADLIAVSASPRKFVEKAKIPYTTIPQFFYFFLHTGIRVLSQNLSNFSSEENYVRMSTLQILNYSWMKPTSQ